MTNGDRIREASAEELAGMLFRWLGRCSRECPALAQCRQGIGCRNAVLAWLNAEEDEQWDG